MLLNIHTHSGAERPTEKAIENIIIPLNGSETEMVIPAPGERWFSAGIHPWYISESDYQSQLVLLEKTVTSTSVKFIGECGLDRIKGPDLYIQTEVFEKQILIAEKLRKPVLIHCVKCFNELFEVTGSLKPSVPVILHGFNNKVEIGRRLINQGFYLSFGAAILREGSNAAEMLKVIPYGQFFLENDNSEVPVSAVYERAAALKNLSVNILEEVIFANYLSLGV